LATGDKINGGAGIDSLVAVVQMAAALGNTSTQAITPITTSVEKASFTALTIDNTDRTNAAETVVINAKSMTGLTHVASVQSDASLTIQNLTTLTDSGVYADRRNTDSVSIRMDHSGNDRALDAQSNMTVLFDNDYLSSTNTSSSADNAFYFLEDRAGAAANPAKPLAKIQNDGIQFTVGGVAKSIKITTAQLNAFNANDGTFAGYTALLKGALVLAATTDASLVGLDITLSATIFKTVGLDGTSLAVPAPAIVLSTASAGAIQATGFSTSSEVLGQYDVYASFDNQALQTTVINVPVTSNVELFKVGRGGNGGDLTIGGMATDLTNTWNQNTTALKAGVERFNISVEGDATQFSSLSSLQSTNNTLREVNVVSTTTTGQTSIAALAIGNQNTAGATTNGVKDNTAALKDVQIFNASTFQGNLTLNASVTSESIAKYMNLKDIAALPAGDNIGFVYTGGLGNDVVNVKLDSAVIESRSTIVSGREDFTFAVNGGAGDDNISLSIVDAALNGNTQAWFVNQKLNNNITVEGGTGNDTIRTLGAGVFKINAGAGNDTVYADNTGGSKAVFVLNTANQAAIGAGYDLVANNERALADLQSSANTSSNLFNGSVTVSFLGLTATANIASTGYKTTDLQVNQAIKAAVNSDPVLSKLLLATDGPANTLVVTALIDGVQSTNVANGGFSVTLAAPAAGTVFSATDLAAMITAYNLPAGSTSAAALTAMNLATTAANGGDYAAKLAETAGNLEFTGAASTAVSEHTINLGAGTDVVVLGTGTGADSIVFSGFDLGSKTIVNFTGADSFDFSSYLVGNATAATVNTDAVVEVNSTTSSTAAVFTTVAGSTFAGLTGATLLAAINSTNTGASNYAGLTNASFNAAATGGVGHAIVMIQNNLNPGEFKAFDLAFNGAAASNGNFTSATLISTFDTGSLVAVAPVVPVPPVVPGANNIVLTAGTTAAVAATADVDVFSFDVAAALASAPNTQISVTGFAAAQDSLTIDTITALGATTLDALNGVDGIAVQANGITNETLINFGPDANGDIVVITLAGVTDAALVNVNVI
jgi:hypothetical protein